MCSYDTGHDRRKPVMQDDEQTLPDVVLYISMHVYIVCLCVGVFFSHLLMSRCCCPFMLFVPCIFFFRAIDSMACALFLAGKRGTERDTDKTPGKQAHPTNKQASSPPAPLSIVTLLTKR